MVLWSGPQVGYVFGGLTDQRSRDQVGMVLEFGWTGLFLS